MDLEIIERGLTDLRKLWSNNSENHVEEVAQRSMHNNWGDVFALKLIQGY